ncbi:MAG: hypothetical protein ABL929_10780 [Ferruginibacter sp.]|nr:hypothetical protein [Ferruginibacter sp.]
MKKILFLATTIIITFSACKKKDVPVTPAPLTTYLSKEIYPNLGTFTWAYNAQNKLSNIVFASENEAANKSYTYIVNNLDAEGKVLDATYDYVSAARADIKVVNTYTADGLLAQTRFTDLATGALLYYDNYIFTGTLIKINNYNALNARTGYSLSTLSADGKNTTETKVFNNSDVLQYTNTYNNFDNIKAAQSLFPKGIYGPLPRTNNYLSQVYTNAAGVPTTYTYTYEANTDGFTTKRISASGAINTFEYIKK